MAALQNRSEKQFLAQCVRRVRNNSISCYAFLCLFSFALYFLSVQLGVAGVEFISLSMFDDILHSVLKIHWSNVSDGAGFWGDANFGLLSECYHHFCLQDQIRRVFQLHLENGGKGSSIFQIMVVTTFDLCLL
jgi:hypothetical protein